MCRSFEIEEKEFVRYYVIRVGTSCFHKRTCCLTVRDRAMDVEVSHDDVVITEVKKKVKVWCEIVGTAGYSGDVNVMNEDGDIVAGGCDGEVLCSVGRAHRCVFATKFQHVLSERLRLLA